MLIPAIDLQNGRIVQLVQGETLALASDDFDGWIEKFSRFPVVQVIDLDAARGEGSNRGLVRDICARLPCQRAAPWLKSANLSVFRPALAAPSRVHV